MPDPFIKQVRIPLPTSSAVDAFLGASLDFHQFMQNAMIEVYPPGTETGVPFVTQRPGFDVSIDASDDGINTNEARGLYFWTGTNATYLVHGDTLYKNNYATGSIIGTLDTNKDPVSFCDAGNYLVISSSKSTHRLWTLSTSDVLTEISDTDCPTQVATGLVFMDGFVFVMDTTGRIHNSDLDAPLTWTALDVIETERDKDPGVALVKHYDNIVALGSRSIEFFYNAYNPVASPLSRREDLFYNIGCAHGPSVWSDGQKAFFIGINSTGTAGIYVLENFNIRKLSPASIDSYLTTMLLREGLVLRAAGISGHGHEFYIISTGIETTFGFQAKASIVYDYTTEFWSSWKSSLNSLYTLESLPVVSTTVFYGALTVAQAQLINGDLVAISDSLRPFDSLRGTSYFVPSADYVDADYVTSIEPSGANIEMIISTGFWDGDTNNPKFGIDIELVGERTSVTQPIVIKWADDYNSTYSAGRQIDLHYNRKLTRLGKFVRRSFQIVAVIPEQIRLYSLELTYKIGRYM